MQLARLTSAGAPVALIGGFVWAASRQPAHYDSGRDTISALAGRGAHDRWIMTTAFVVLGLCHLGTAYGLRSRVLALGGLATVLLAVAPEPAHGSSAIHAVIAFIALVSLALWPLPRHRAAVAVLAGLLLWFFVALEVGSAIGVAERCVAVAQALWPIVVVRKEIGGQFA